MEMMALEDLVDKVISNLPGCDTMQGEEKLRESAIRFFRATSLWKHTMPDLNVYSGEPSYPLTYPAESIPERIVRARFRVEDGGRPYRLWPKSELDLDRLYGGEWESITGTPRWYTHIEDNLNVRLVPIPDADLIGALMLQISVVPALDATSIPASLANKYWRTLEAGARFELTTMKDQPWSDPNAAKLALIEFGRGLATGITDRSQGSTTAPQKMMAEYPLA